MRPFDTLTELTEAEREIAAENSGLLYWHLTHRCGNADGWLAETIMHVSVLTYLQSVKTHDPERGSLGTHVGTCLRNVTAQAIARRHPEYAGLPEELLAPPERRPDIRLPEDLTQDEYLAARMVLFGEAKVKHLSTSLGYSKSRASRLVARTATKIIRFNRD